jgi:predicted phage baseplate assembly protein
VDAGTLTTLLTSIAGIDSNKVTNLFAASGGRDEETLDHAKKRAPLALKSRCRAVTREDFEYLARQASSVKRAFAIPLAHPGFPGVKVPGAVTVVVVPDSDDPNPLPTDGMLRTVCAYLNLRRLLTTELFVVPPLYQLVFVHAEIVAKNSADLAEVKTAVEKALLNYFHPLRGGEDGQGWPFGGTIFFSRVYQQILKVPGVERVEKVIITLDKQPYPECQDIPIQPGSLVYSTENEVLVNYALNQ